MGEFFLGMSIDGVSVSRFLRKDIEGRMAGFFVFPIKGALVEPAILEVEDRDNFEFEKTSSKGCRGGGGVVLTFCASAKFPSDCTDKTGTRIKCFKDACKLWPPVKVCPSSKMRASVCIWCLFRNFFSPVEKGYVGFSWNLSASD